MNLCLFCGSAESLTDEHVIPAALGGELVVPRGTCQKCNGGFSDDFEASFLNGLKPVLHILGIENRDGKVPSTEVDFEIDGMKLRGFLTGNGDLIPQDKKMESVDGDGTPFTRYLLWSKKSRKTLEERARRYGKKLVPETNIGAAISVQPHSGLELNFLCAESARRSIAKIAIFLMASKAGAGIARSEAFVDLREYVQHGVGDCPVRLFDNSEFFAATRSSAFHHLLLLWADGRLGTVSAIVVLFGGLSYIVELSSRYRGADFSTTYAYDARLRTQEQCFVQSLENERLAIDLVKGGASTFDDLPAVAERWAIVIEAGARFLGR